MNVSGLTDVCVAADELYTVYRCVFFFQGEDGIRDLVRSRGLGDVYKRQGYNGRYRQAAPPQGTRGDRTARRDRLCHHQRTSCCLLYTSDAADERSSVDLGGRRIIKKKKTPQAMQQRPSKVEDNQTSRVQTYVTTHHPTETHIT